MYLNKVKNNNKLLYNILAIIHIYNNYERIKFICMRLDAWTANEIRIIFISI